MADETLKIKVTADAEAAKQGLKGVGDALKNVGIWLFSTKAVYLYRFFVN